MKEEIQEALVNDDILTIEHITKTYYGVVALDDVSFSIRRGEIHALVGENGAGKSTLIKIISGFTNPDRGQFIVDGKTFSQITPRQAHRRGIETIYQDLNLIPDLSVAENVFLGEELQHQWMFKKTEIEKRASEVFALLGVSIDPAESVENLSTAQMQFVTIAKAMASDVKLLILDEPTAALASQDVEILFRLIHRLKSNGVSMIYISHRLNEIYALSDRITVMRDGKLIHTAAIEDIPMDKLIRMMVGRKLSETYPERKNEVGDVFFKVKGLVGNGVQNLSFELHKGEILGFAGLVGSRRTEMVRMLFGADLKERGHMELDGETVDIKSPRDAVKLGIGFVPEDRKNQGVLLGRSIQENISLSIIKKISRFLCIDRDKEKEVIEKYKNMLHIKTPSVLQLVQNLSGGNQQKVAVSKWLASSSQILIFDEPTQGIDVGAKYEIYQIMNQLTRQGVSIIMISSEMEELIGMADRVIVLHEGQMTGELKDRNQFDQEEIMKLASKIGEKI